MKNIGSNGSYNVFITICVLKSLWVIKLQVMDHIMFYLYIHN